MPTVIESEAPSKDTSMTSSGTKSGANGIKESNGKDPIKNENGVERGMYVYLIVHTLNVLAIPLNAISIIHNDGVQILPVTK